MWWLVWLTILCIGLFVNQAVGAALMVGLFVFTLGQLAEVWRVWRDIRRGR
jgi:hypothetical protein